MIKMSGLVITYNEAGNIQACLESLFKVCDDVVVVDSLSSDDTVTIAKAAGAKVYSQVFLGYGPQKNYGLQFCQHAWVLSLDADERLEADAIAEIQGLNLADSPYDAYEFRRKNLFHGKWIRCVSWYPDHVRRLFNREKTRFSDAACHEAIQSQQYQQLHSHIVHTSFVDYSQMLQKLDEYTNQYAAANMHRKRVSAFAPPLHGLFAFFKHYLFRRGFLCGFDGFTIALLNALGSYFKYAKLLEKQRYGSGALS
ncbi:Glycosyltransferase involved in cell wall bisynthesis [Thiothrix caldifontis]|uniref:Glycosyltransferase involved in cell wall bisynthesis n=1 Tax=Thiothrix caldifontis TaxID=525918 RepID=A0A1H3VWW1_9GAMM|nr:glycosyltransferase family 2 protein [Thiothrix caldifontis]SDZ78592.1 Glycosyltransferase involved in cell wall bisynthesis [Thiothrix caldifontis]